MQLNQYSEGIVYIRNAKRHKINNKLNVDLKEL